MPGRNISSRVKLITTCVVVLVLIGTAGYLLNGWYRGESPEVAGSADEHGDEPAGHDEHAGEGETETVQLPKEMWDSARLEIAPVRRQTLTAQKWATGKVTVNEDRTAHIYSITEGVAHKVPVTVGDQVEEGQLLAVIDSREVGSAKLDLLQARLQKNFAEKENQFAQQVKTNAMQLIDALESGKSLDQINQQLQGKPIGTYRDQLLGAYTQYVRAKADYDRLQPIAETGAVAGKQLIAAEAEFNAARSDFNAVLEQLRFSIPQDTLEAEQQLREAEQAVAVATAKLSILGYSPEDLERLDLSAKGEQLSHYEVRAPFAGTITDKNVVLAERVGTDTEMFRITDLSTLWVQADIYQKDLASLKQLGQTLRFRAPTGDDGSMHTHKAKIFYRGDIIDPDTRTMRLRAIVANEDGHLKPGMFVEIQIPSGEARETLAVPESAIQGIDGKQVVFVQTGETSFRLQPVVLGDEADGRVPVREGLQAGDRVVVSGGFALKSELKKSEISHGH